MFRYDFSLDISFCYNAKRVTSARLAERGHGVATSRSAGVAHQIAQNQGDQPMSTLGWLTTREINEIFANEVEAAGGRMSDVFDDGARIFLRAVLVGEKEIQPGDRVQGGVAVRATSDEIWVHPYLFREVCSNGAIRAHAIETREIRRLDFSTDEQAEVAGALCEAIRACCCDEAFAHGAADMRSARESSEVDVALSMMPLFARLAQGAGSKAVISFIIDRFFADRDKSRFGLMNAVTSVARDTRDPEVRWRLEEFGGGIAAVVANPNRGPARARAQVLVGA
jgi:hypothetical protein